MIFGRKINDTLFLYSKIILLLKIILLFDSFWLRFQIVFSDKIINYLISKSNKYHDKNLKIKYVNDFEEKTLQPKSYNSNPYLSIKKGITMGDLLCIKVIRIFIRLHKLFALEWYANDNIFLYKIYKIIIYY